MSSSERGGGGGGGGVATMYDQWTSLKLNLYKWFWYPSMSYQVSFKFQWTDGAALYVRLRWTWRKLTPSNGRFIMPNVMNNNIQFLPKIHSHIMRGRSDPYAKPYRNSYIYQFTQYTKSPTYITYNIWSHRLQLMTKIMFSRYWMKSVKTPNFKKADSSYLE